MLPGRAFSDEQKKDPQTSGGETACHDATLLLGRMPTSGGISVPKIRTEIIPSHRRRAILGFIGQSTISLPFAEGQSM